MQKLRKPKVKQVAQARNRKPKVAPVTRPVGKQPRVLSSRVPIASKRGRALAAAVARTADHTKGVPPPYVSPGMAGRKSCILITGYTQQTYPVSAGTELVIVPTPYSREAYAVQSGANLTLPANKVNDFTASTLSGVPSSWFGDNPFLTATGQTAGADDADYHRFQPAGGRIVAEMSVPWTGMAEGFCFGPDECPNAINRHRPNDDDASEWHEDISTGVQRPEVYTGGNAAYSVAWNVLANSVSRPKVQMGSCDAKFSYELAISRTFGEYWAKYDDVAAVDNTSALDSAKAFCIGNTMNGLSQGQGFLYFNNISGDTDVIVTVYSEHSYYITVPTENPIFRAIARTLAVHPPTVEERMACGTAGMGPTPIDASHARIQRDYSVTEIRMAGSSETLQASRHLCMAPSPVSHQVVGSDCKSPAVDFHEDGTVIKHAEASDAEKVFTAAKDTAKFLYDNRDEIASAAKTAWDVGKAIAKIF